MLGKIKAYLHKRKLKHLWHKGNTFTYAKGTSVRPSFRCQKKMWLKFKAKHKNPSARLKELIEQDVSS